jgi:aryl-alcohol dehydrogenase-like predicted oxidoreductase
MEKRILGKTGLEVSELGLGGGFISSQGETSDEAKALICKSIESDINYIDTAPAYLDSETVIGNVIKDIRKPIILSTKVGGYPDPFDPRNKKQLFKSVHDSLKKLNRDHIDILFIHEPDRPGQYDWWNESTDYLAGPVLEVIDSLKKEGLIKYSGLAGTTAYEMANLIKLGNFDVLLTAFQYSLLWREAAICIIPEAKKKNMGIVIGSPLQHGALAQRYDAEVLGKAKWLSNPRRNQLLELYELLDELNISIVEISLRFVLSNPDISTVLVGARSKKEIYSSIRASEKGPLPLGILERLDKIAEKVPFRPYCEPYNMPFNKDYRGPGWIK